MDARMQEKSWRTQAGVLGRGANLGCRTRGRRKSREWSEELGLELGLDRKWQERAGAWGRAGTSMVGLG